MKRRSFFKVMGTAAGGYAVTRGGVVLAETAPAAPLERVSGMPRRVLGRTGQKVSMIGFSGLAPVQQGQEEDTTALHRAFDLGHYYRDLTLAELNEVVRLAWSCRSVFQAEESQVSGTAAYPGIPYHRAAGEFV